jgi:uncharacterized protein
LLLLFDIFARLNARMKRLVYGLIIALEMACAVVFAIPTATAQPALSPQVQTLLASARAQARVTRTYDPRYVMLRYPGGDVPVETGVCTDVIIRALRALGTDLQRAVHEDMAAHFSAYPRKWGLTRPDTNIDHRRVPNLMTYFSRLGKALPIKETPAHFKPGDIVAWDLGTGQSHIGIVSDENVAGSQRMRIYHNIGAGVQHEDVLFKWKVIGHYRL